MRTFAYCATSFEKSVRRAAGVAPLLSPPITLDTFKPHWLMMNYDFLYFKLHGLPGQPYWYGDNWNTALSADLIRQADLTGTIVFVANCYLYEDDPPGKDSKKLADKNFPGPMLTALLAAGARCVVGGAGKNYGRPISIYSADLLGMNFRLLVQIGFKPKHALSMAKARIRLKRNKDKETKDALDFRIFDRDTLKGAI